MLPKMLFLSICFSLLFYQTTLAIPLTDFYPFGVEAGDSVLPRTLDGSSLPIKLVSSLFPFYGQEYDQLFVNANGHITFLSALGAFVPQNFPLVGALPMIAPFWADSDTQPDDGGFIWYRESNDQALLSLATHTIGSKFLGVDSFSPHFLFIATWDHIGYYSGHTDKTNTFQCVIVTDGEISFVIFMYAEGLIQWLWSDDHVGNPAEVGVNAGDGIRFFRHPDSNTLNLLNITETSNVGKDGVWIIRTDREGIPINSCRKESNVAINLIPRSGNMLGGTGVFISGPCFDDKIKCRFDTKEVDGVSVSNDNSLWLCVTPTMTRTGEVPVEIQDQVATYKSTFFSLSPERAYTVDFTPGGLLFAENENRVISWSPNSIVPVHLVPNATYRIKVDISLHIQKLESGSEIEYDWTEENVLLSEMPNDGQANVVIPEDLVSCKYPPRVDFKLDVCPIAFKISFSSADPDIKLELPTTLGQWSGIAFLRANGTDTDLRENCEKWDVFDNEYSRLANLIPCPPTLRLARFDPQFQESQSISLVPTSRSRYFQSSMELFHPDAHVCYNEVVPQNSPAGQECCYDFSGNLITGPPGGGSADLMSPRVDYNGHLVMDLAPYLICCTGGSPNCDVYYSERPSRSEREYRLPIPACIYGDPHIVTLDGLKYTFNGKGEFVLIETNDGSFTMQGRMEPATNADGLNAPGTVFTAIVALQNETNTSVQFEIKTTGVKVRLDGVVVNFDDMKEIKYSDVTLEDKGNATVLASFSKGATVELSVENGIVSVMLVSLPAYLKGNTRGLMGNFNGDPSDDLLPRNGSIPLPPDSSLEHIHNVFGITWIIKDAKNSSFVYNPGEVFNTYYDPFFIPVFEPNFNDSELEEEALKICDNDKFCLFDIAATKRKEIGATTLTNSENFEAILNSSKPIMCEPKCQNGTCVEENTCACSQGFTGDRCQFQVMSDCDNNVCQNNGTCTKHVLSIICHCQPGYIGTFCQEEEPPFHITLINSSPRIGSNKLFADFFTSKPVIEAKCYLSGLEERDCTSGYVSFENVPAATYIFRVVAKTKAGERHVIRRIVPVFDEQGSGENLLTLCSAHLINEGVVVRGNEMTAQFVGDGPVTSLQCRLDSHPFRKCRSPISYQDLPVGSHRLQVKPLGDSCDKMKRLSVKFEIV